MKKYIFISALFLGIFATLYSCNAENETPFHNEDTSVGVKSKFSLLEISYDIYTYQRYEYDHDTVNRI